jgi:hypothetical protein
VIKCLISFARNAASIAAAEPEKLCTTLDYLGGLLIGVDVYATILGKQWTAKLNAALNRAKNWLDPRVARRRVHKFTVGPIATLALAIMFLVFGWVVFLELRNPAVWRVLSSSEPNFIWWLLKSFWIVLFKPIACVGLAAGIYASRSPQSKQHFDTWTEKLTNWIARYQMQNAGGKALLVAFVGSLVWGVFTVFFVLGGWLLVLMFHLVTAPLTLARLLLERDRLRRVAAVIGLGMITASYIIRMKH